MPPVAIGHAAQPSVHPAKPAVTPRSALTQCAFEQPAEGQVGTLHPVKQPASTSLKNEPDPALERIKDLEEQLALAPINSPQRRTLRAAIRLEAQTYRKSLDVEQASARYDTRW